MKKYIGIDVGKLGAIVMINPRVIGDKVVTYPAPLLGTEINAHRFAELLKSLIDGDPNTLVIIEDVHAIFGSAATSTFQFGRALGIVEGIVSTLEVPFIKVKPKEWQEVSFQGVPVIEKPGTKAKGRGRYDTKAMALIAAQRLYPRLDLTATDRSKKPHQGIVDALLIAHYATIKL